MLFHHGFSGGPRRLALLLALAVFPAFGLVNSANIRETAGQTTNNYPVQFGRPFAQGEIPNAPQALLDGAPVVTQADVKSRWPDGSVKHAILSFLIPTLRANSAVTVTFRDQPATNGAGALDQAGMLNPAFDFEAAMELTNGGTLRASARTMLQAGAYTYWLKGSVATSVVLADHSLNRAYDIGFDANRAFRPIFHATFWPGIGKVQVRMIGENANTEAIEDQSYDLTLKLGQTAPVTVYSKTGVTHWAMTRWSKQFWMGGAPPAVAIDHNLAYLESTRAVFNYDPSISINETAIANRYAAWTAAPKDLYDTGTWDKAMGSGGAHAWIGPVAEWNVFWLYTGDPRMKEWALGQTDLAGAWPIHIREGKAGKRLLASDAAGAGVGHVLSIKDRPSLWLVLGTGDPLGYSYINAADKITPVGSYTGGTFDYGKWSPDAMHHPDTWSVPYLLTGDFWYLEELWFSVGWVAATECGPCTTASYGRGPTGGEGGIGEQIRAGAWAVRNRAAAGFLTPDGLPEKTYSETLLNDFIAIEEGARNLSGSPFAQTGNPQKANWDWGRAYRAQENGAFAYPTLRQWKRGSASFAQGDYGICADHPAGYTCTPATTLEAVSLFEQDYLTVALGRAKELGYPADRLLTWLAPSYVGQLTDSGYNPYLIANGRIPTTRVSDGQYFPSWADLKSGYTADWQSKSSFDLANTDGFDAYALAAASMVANETGGAAAWSFISGKMLAGNASFKDNPKWALTPRGAAVPQPLPTPAPFRCDVNGDGQLTAADADVARLQATGAASCTVDLDGNGRCDAVDVQRVIDAVLGGVCRLGL